MNNKIFIFIIIFYLDGILISWSQPPAIQWQKCAGGTASEVGLSIRQTYDGGYMVGGTTASSDGDVTGNHSTGLADYWVIKLDSLGTLEWQKCYGGTIQEAGYSLELTNDSGFIMAGYGTSIDGDCTGGGWHTGGNDFWIVKCDYSGTIQWQKYFGGSDDDDARKIICTYDKGYLVAGYASSKNFDVTDLHIDSSICASCGDCWVVKLDSAGTLQWAHCYGGSWGDIAFSLVQSADSNYLIVGNVYSNDGDVTNNHGSHDYWLVKIDQSGSILWQKCLGGSWNEGEDGRVDLINTLDGGYMMIGNTQSNDFDVSGHNGGNPNEDAWVVKLDNFGNIQWQKCLGGTGYDYGTMAFQLADSSYLALCYTNSIDGDVSNNHSFSTDIWLVKLDTSGNIEWEICYGGTSVDQAYDIQQTSDGGFVFTGTTFSNDGDVSGNHGAFDTWVVKLSSLPDAVLSPVNSLTDFSFYMNQSNENIILNFFDKKTEKVTLQLIDITGRVLFQESLSTTSGQNKKEFPVGILSKGIYMISLQSEGGMITKKMVVQ